MRTADANPERQLWAAVIVNAIRDLGLVSSSENALAVHKIKSWVGNSPSRDFATVCSLAGLEVEPVHEFFRTLLSMRPDDRRKRCRELTGDKGRRPADESENRQRVVLLTREGLSMRQISARLGIAPSVVHRHAVRARGDAR